MENPEKKLRNPLENFAKPKGKLRKTKKNLVKPRNPTKSTEHPTENTKGTFWQKKTTRKTWDLFQFSSEIPCEGGDARGQHPEPQDPSDPQRGRATLLRERTTAGDRPTTSRVEWWVGGVVRSVFLRVLLVVRVF